MSIALLLDKYDVSTEEGLQKALNEIDNEEAEVEDALCGALSKACAIEGRLRTASQAYTKLGEVKNDAVATCNMVERTAILARDVSAKVRQLDLARSRVAECQQRVNDLIDLQLCSAGVEAAIKAQDYETGAAHVSRFLSMDPGSVAAARARGAPDPRLCMQRAADTLRDQLVHKFEEAARRDDEAAIDRLYRLFPQIGRAHEGVELLSKYLARKLESSQRRICTAEGAGGAGCAYADALTRWLEAGGAAVERARVAAPAHLPHILRHLQPKVCAGARRVCGALMSSRGVGGVADTPDPLVLEPLIAELALAHSRIMLYFNFLRRKAEVDASSLSESARAALVRAVSELVDGCDLTRTAQDLLGHYLTLERYFLEESMGKVLRLSRAPDASSLVDDAFFVARKVIRRAITSGSVEGVCVVLNEASSLLEHALARALRTSLRAAPPGTLPLAPPGTPPASLLAHTLQADLRDQRALFLALMAEAESGAHWAERLGEEAYNEAVSLARTEAERDKLSSCAAQLAGAGAALRSAHAHASAALLASLRQSARAHAAALAQPKSLEDGDDSELVPAALDALHAAARASLSAASADQLLAALLAEMAQHAEDQMLRHSYTREQGTIVERRARRLATWSGSVGARERCAALTQAAELLAADSIPARAPPRVPLPRARDLLARRVDFKLEDIKKLKS